MGEESPFGLYLDLLKTLEQLRIPYVVIGAFAGMAYGVTRLSVDVDIVVDLDEKHIQALAAAFPPPRYYADPQQMRDSIRQGVMFHIIDGSAGRKADLISVTMKPGYEFAIRRRIRRAIPLPGEDFAAWFARPDDVIVGKLMAWKEGRAFKHEQDIRDILVDVRRGEDDVFEEYFDFDYLEQWVGELGREIKQFWEGLRAITD